MGPILSSLLSEVQKSIPKAQIKFKDKSMFMKFLGVLLFFNKSFMTRYTTTIGFTVYFPNEADATARDEAFANVFSHESVHMSDYKKWGVLFKLSYLLPQLLAVFALLSILAIWFSKLWLLNLLWLLMVAPIPAYFRSHWELRGYVMDLAYDHWKFNAEPDPSRYLNRFTTSGYYFMWPFSGHMKRRFEKMIAKMKSGNLFLDQPYKVVHDWIEAEKTKAA